MAKKIMLDLIPIWRQRNEQRPGNELVRSLAWTVLTYGAEWWTLTRADEKGIESAESWVSFLGHTIRYGGCELVKCAIQGKVNGKQMLLGRMDD